MKKRPQKYYKTTAIIWLGCLVFFVFIYFVVHKTQKQTIAALEIKLAEEQKKYTSAIAAASEESKLKLQQEVEELKKKLRVYVADVETASTLTFDISRIASEEKVGSFSIKGRDGRSISEVPQCTNIAESNLDVSFVGKFSQFANFLNTLERYSPVVFIDWFVIRRPQQEGSMENEVTMGLSVFVEKQNADKT